MVRACEPLLAGSLRWVIRWVYNPGRQLPPYRIWIDPAGSFHIRPHRLLAFEVPQMYSLCSRCAYMVFKMMQ
jgi:hypothetical protein